MPAENAGQGANNDAGSVVTLTPPAPELVQRVADAVYQLFLRDLKLERERRGDNGLPARTDSRPYRERG